MWKLFAEQVLSWIGMEDEALHNMLKAVVAQPDQVVHGHGRDSVLFFAHLSGWATETQAKGILNNVRNNDGVEAWRQLARRFNPQTALTKGTRLRAITGFGIKNPAKRNADVLVIIGDFEKKLANYATDFKSEALTDDLKKDTLQ